MDAAADITVRAERITEPLSGMALFRVTGYWDAAVEVSRFAVEVRYDGSTANRSEFVRADAADVPAGRTRFNFGTQFPIEEDRQRLEVVLVGDGERVLLSRVVAEIGMDIPGDSPASGFLSRTIRSITSGEAFALWRWKARISRLSEKLLVLRQKVRYKLLARRFRPRSTHDAYVENTTVTPRLRQAMRAEWERWAYRPTFSILVPVYNVDPKWLKIAIASVLNQTYPQWELCLADDHSTRTDLLEYLDSLPDDPRIKLTRRYDNGHICRATNTAAEVATGEFICLLDNDDALAPNALFAVAERLQHHRDAELIYSDEDKIDAASYRYDPQFKPDWSPELLLSYNYINHFTVIRRNVFEKAGRFRPGFEGSQDHDLLLRITELTDRIQHIPQILYHWRSLPESTASSAGVKEYVHTSGRRAVEEALHRRGIDAALDVPAFAKKLNLPVLALDGPDDGPSVAIVIRGECDAVVRSHQAVRAKTTYRNYTFRDAADGDEEFVLFLGAELEPTDSRWLSRLMAHFRIAGIGAVGGVVKAADGTIHDTGPVLGMNDGIGVTPAFAGHKPVPVSYYFYAEVTRNTAAVSERCLLTRRTMFADLGVNTSRALWNVEYGLRLRARGLRCVTVGGVEFVSRESKASVDALDNASRYRHLMSTFGRLVDPFHNPNCSERDTWRPMSDSPLSLPVEARTPAVRTLIIAHNLNNPEGAPRYLSEIVIGLRERGSIAPVVFSPLGGPGAKVYDVERIPVIVRERPQSQRFVDGLWSPREYEAAQVAAAKLLQEQRPELVIANTLTTFPLVEAAARQGIPAVWIIHESYSREHLARLFPPFARKRVEQAFTLAARVVPASHDTTGLFAHLNTRGNVRVIHNGLDAKPFDEYLRRMSKTDAGQQLGFDPLKKHLIAVGTVCERKGQHTLVEAAARLVCERSDFVVHLVGMREGIPYAEYVRQLVKRHRLEGVVNLVSETDGVWAYFRAADVFVCTSHMETFSRAVLEAEAFGLPIVSTACSGLSEQVVWNGNALRFDFGDAIGLADRVRRLLADDTLRADMSQESRAMFDVHLNQDEMLDRYETLCLAAARQGPRAETPFIPAPLGVRRAA